jgi:hypothetical protein
MTTPYEKCKALASNARWTNAQKVFLWEEIRHLEKILHGSDYDLPEDSKEEMTHSQYKVALGALMAQVALAVEGIHIYVFTWGNALSRIMQEIVAQEAEKIQFIYRRHDTLCRFKNFSVIQFMTTGSPFRHYPFDWDSKKEDIGLKHPSWMVLVHPEFFEHSEGDTRDLLSLLYTLGKPEASTGMLQYIEDCDARYPDKSLP